MRYTTNISLCLIALSASALGWTEAETNAVVREMVGIAQRQLESEASIGSDNIVFPPVPEVETFDDLFLTERQTQLSFWSQWTPAERRTAFENFLADKIWE